MRHLTLLRPGTPARHVIVVRELATGKESETDIRGVARSVIDHLLSEAHRIADPRRFVIEEVQGYGRGAA